MHMNLLDISRLLGAVCVGMAPEDALERPTGAAIDSREVAPGNLFFCLPGERADGHDFAAAAAEKGALAMVGTRDPFPRGELLNRPPVFVVPDVAEALRTIAAAHRKQTRASVIGVTGTSGKTSVKEVLASVLGVAGKTAKSPVNRNNQIGLPCSLCNAPSDAAYWVMEVGISRPQDMDELAAILRPDTALILNAGAGHVQELGDKGTAYYKSRMLAHVAAQGHGVVSADYPDLTREAARHGVECLAFSAANEEELYYAAYLGPDGLNRGLFHLVLDGEALTVSAPFPGPYGAENVAAIGAVAHSLGLTASEIAAGFAAASLPDQRFSVQERGAFVVIDDSYNANPLSMSRMLDAAAAHARNSNRPLILVLGEMGELGPESGNFHDLLGIQAAALSPCAVFWKGGQKEAVEKGLREGGYTGTFLPVADGASFAAAWGSLGAASGVVLFKGSRSNKLEELVAAFQAATDTGRTGVTGAAAKKGRADAL